MAMWNLQGGKSEIKCKRALCVRERIKYFTRDLKWMKGKDNNI